MTKKNILFVSWQGGLGHITRDLQIIKELRKRNPEVEVSWLTHPLGSRLIQEAGETLLPESQLSADYNGSALIHAVDNFRLNLMKYVTLARNVWVRNADLFNQVNATYSFDLIIGDESYEVQRAIAEGKFNLKCKMVMIEDFVGVDSMSMNPLEVLSVDYNNFVLYGRFLPRLRSRIERFFVGELEDILDRKLGLFLPNRRKIGQEYYHILGHVVRFDPENYADKWKIRAKLGYGKEALIICATGGIAAGKEMLETCGKAYIILKQDLPDLRMICVCGELYGQDQPELPQGVELHTYIRDIYEHYAACDMAVVVGGGTTTAELTALRRPFVFFPLENQFDQQINVAGRLKRQGAGIKMRYHQTSPESLATTIFRHFGKDVDWEAIPTNGAQKAADLIHGFLATGAFQPTRPDAAVGSYEVQNPIKAWV